MHVQCRRTVSVLGREAQSDAQGRNGVGKIPLSFTAIMGPHQVWLARCLMATSAATRNNLLGLVARGFSMTVDPLASDPEAG